MYFHDHRSACGQFDRWRRGDPALYRDWKSWSNPLYRSNKVNKMDSFPIRKYEVISYRGKVDKENTKKERVNEESERQIHLELHHGVVQKRKWYSIMHDYGQSIERIEWRHNR